MRAGQAGARIVPSAEFEHYAQKWLQVVVLTWYAPDLQECRRSEIRGRTRAAQRRTWMRDVLTGERCSITW